LLEKHATVVRELEGDLRAAASAKLRQPAPQLSPGVSTDNDDMPRLAAMQTDLLVNAFANDMARIASLQFTNSVGQARMRWLGIDEGHHSLSHDPDLNEGSQEKLTKIKVWFCEQLAALARKLDAIPEPGHEGSMLDHTTILWTNELGKGNSHTLRAGRRWARVSVGSFAPVREGSAQPALAGRGACLRSPDFHLRKHAAVRGRAAVAGLSGHAANFITFPRWSGVRSLRTST
jgi:hypothetical protein